MRASQFVRSLSLLSVGLASTSLLTFAFFALSSSTLTGEDYGRVALLWSSTMLVVAIVYRPAEQQLTHRLARDRAYGFSTASSRRTAIVLLGISAACVTVAAQLVHETLRDSLFDGSEVFYVAFVASCLAYAVSYGVRGVLAGTGRYAAYAAHLTLEATVRLLFAVAVAVGIARGASVVGTGIAAAPAISTLAVALAVALRTRARVSSGPGEGGREPSRAGTPVAFYAVAVGEQLLLSAAVLFAQIRTSDPVAAGVVFNLLLLVRAPLALFLAVQISLLPHFTALVACGATREIRRVTLGVLAASLAGAAAYAVLLGLAGPQLTELVFGATDYEPLGLAFIAIGLGLHLVAGALTQLLLAAGRGRAVVLAWSLPVGCCVGWLAVSGSTDLVAQAQTTYVATAAAVTLILAWWAAGLLGRHRPASRSAG